MMKLEPKLRAESMSEAARKRMHDYIERHHHVLEYDNDLRSKIQENTHTLCTPILVARIQRARQIQRHRAASVNWENQSSTHRSI